MDLKRNLSISQGLREIGGFGGSKSIEIILELGFGLVIVVSDDDVGGGILVRIGIGVEGNVGRTPIGTEEDGGRADVEENDGIAGADVVLDGPADGEGTFVGEVNGDADFAAGAGGGGGGGGGGVVARGGGMVDFDVRELRARIQ